MKAFTAAFDSLSLPCTKRQGTGKSKVQEVGSAGTISPQRRKVHSADISALSIQVYWILYIYIYMCNPFISSFYDFYYNNRRNVALA